MAEIKPSTAPAGAKKPATTQQGGNSSNAISVIAPILCIILGYCIWRFGIGSPSNFEKPDLAGGFWPKHEGPKGGFAKMYEGGIIVPLLIAFFLCTLTFSIERALTILKAKGTGNIGNFIRQVQFNLANKDIDKAIALCDKQKGSVGNVMKAGLKTYKEMITVTDLDTDQKLMAIQKDIEEATALELPMLQKNLVFISTIASVATLFGLLGTVVGMITSFAALGDGGGGNASDLSKGISEALYNTALGIGTSAVSIIMYNIFTTKIDAVTHGIDESGFTLGQSFQTNYK
ncbi:MotA/TolQ/ExbB proton channel family protein [Rhizosphaericola mali]|uniref:MotA/TolQ/ExbB proton channel family protein n=1 Tax=Rhizosphaericola mali TaxID=2545455 RepID=A0A5P2G5W9_9BACT|nr:MotA/TolQ/ExbB proton channel family protein [Rhizosphaericola mali]QES90667.1 MotA/TolQ/ExbB proton channel family protein [Rhizosphaericola mali]